MIELWLIVTIALCATLVCEVLARGLDYVLKRIGGRRPLGGIQKNSLPNDRGWASPLR
jgi:hypothetical protein